MVNYRELYYMLFRAMRDATELLEKKEEEAALEALIAAQQRAEEAYLEG